MARKFSADVNKICLYDQRCDFVMQKPLAVPYIPSGTVSSVLLGCDTPVSVLSGLLSKGIDLIETDHLKVMPPNLSSHADMQFVNVCEGVIVHAPGVLQDTTEKLRTLGFELIEGETIPGSYYPYDIAYNCAIVGKVAFLNLKYTDQKLLTLIKKCGIKPVPVKQGYAKCSTCVLNEKAIITADKSIHNAALENGIDSLLIPPQRRIVLKGYDYGFIGGATGLISEHELAFAGDFKKLDQADSMASFMTKYGIMPVSLSDESVADVGGLIPLSSV